MSEVVSNTTNITEKIVIKEGVMGEHGLSAYQVWLAQGNVGTEKNYLDSLAQPALDVANAKIIEMNVLEETVEIEEAKRIINETDRIDAEIIRVDTYNEIKPLIEDRVLVEVFDAGESTFEVENIGTITSDLVSVKTQLAHTTQQINTLDNYKANATDVNATNLRIDNLVIPISPENTNIEVTDAHNSIAKSKNFTSLKERFEETEFETSFLFHNFLLNSNFEDTSNWSSLYCTISASDNVLIVTADGTNGLPALRQDITMPIVVGQKFYLQAEIYLDEAPALVRMFTRPTGESTREMAYNDIPITGEYTTIYGISTALQSYTGLWCELSPVYSSGEKALGKTMKVKNFIAIDLTSIFGANIPTADEMKELLTYFPSTWFSGSNNFSKPKFLFNYFLNKIREKNIIDSEQDIAINNLSSQKSFNSNNIKMIGHAGLGTYAPENTLAGVWKASEYGFWGTECDLRITSDGYFVLMHDATVDGTTTGIGNVSDMTLSQIKALDVDSGEYITDFGTLKVPTFEEYLQVCKEVGIVPIIEARDFTDVQIISMFEIIKKYGFEQSCIVISFYTATIEKLRSLSDDIMLQPLLDLTEINIDYCASLGKNTGIDTSYTLVTKELIDYAHSKSVKVGCYTVDGANTTLDLIRYGVDYITTNGIMWNQKIETQNILYNLGDGNAIYTYNVPDLALNKDVLNGEVFVKYTDGTPPTMLLGTQSITAEETPEVWQKLKWQSIAAGTRAKITATGTFEYKNFKVIHQKM